MPSSPKAMSAGLDDVIAPACQDQVIGIAVVRHVPPVVVGQQQTTRRFGRPAGPGLPAHAGKAAAEGLHVAPTQVDIAGGAGDADALNAQGGKCEQLTALTGTVLVQILP